MDSTSPPSLFVDVIDGGGDKEISLGYKKIDLELMVMNLER